MFLPEREERRFQSLRVRSPRCSGRACAPASPGAPSILGAGRGAPAREHPRPPESAGPWRRGAEPAPASPAGWSREPEISARTASLPSPKQPGMATPESGNSSVSAKNGCASCSGAGRWAGGAPRSSPAERRRRDAGVGGPILYSR